MSAFLRSIAIYGVAAVIAGQTAYGQDAGDPEKGHKLATDICAVCHGVEKGYEPSPEPFAPSFEAIANTPGMTPTALSIFLRTPHATMPNLVFADDELADIIAYVMSLK